MRYLYSSVLWKNINIFVLFPQLLSFWMLFHIWLFIHSSSVHGLILLRFVNSLCTITIELIIKRENEPLIRLLYRQTINTEELDKKLLYMRYIYFHVNHKCEIYQTIRKSLSFLFHYYIYILVIIWFACIEQSSFPKRPIIFFISSSFIFSFIYCSYHLLISFLFLFHLFYISL